MYKKALLVSRVSKRGFFFPLAIVWMNTPTNLLLRAVNLRDDDAVVRRVRRRELVPRRRELLAVSTPRREELHEHRRIFRADGACERVRREADRLT